MMNAAVMDSRYSRSFGKWMAFTRFPVGNHFFCDLRHALGRFRDRAAGLGSFSYLKG
jgi:hypothetical protein